MLNPVPQDLIDHWHRATSEPLDGASLDVLVPGDHKIICVGPSALGYYDAETGLRGHTLTDFEAVFRTDDGFAACLWGQPIPAYHGVSGRGFGDRLARMVARLFRLLGPICAVVGFVLVSATLAALEAVGFTVSNEDWRGGLLIGGAVVGWFGLRAPILMWLEKRGYRWA
jgi:hypothetical protein